MRWYLHPAITDTILSTLSIYRQEIPPGSRSGRLKFQGGADPVHRRGPRPHHARRRQARLGSGRRASTCRRKRDGIVVQHFNDDPEKTAVFLAVEPNLFAATSVDRGCGFHQMEQSPDYKRGRECAENRITTMAEIERTRDARAGHDPGNAV